MRFVVIARLQELHKECEPKAVLIDDVTWDGQIHTPSKVHPSPTGQSITQNKHVSMSMCTKGGSQGQERNHTGCVETLWIDDDQLNLAEHCVRLQTWNTHGMRTIQALWTRNTPSFIWLCLSGRQQRLIQSFILNSSNQRSIQTAPSPQTASCLHDTLSTASRKWSVNACRAHISGLKILQLLLQLCNVTDTVQPESTVTQLRT